MWQPNEDFSLLSPPCCASCVRGDGIAGHAYIVKRGEEEPEVPSPIGNLATQGLSSTALCVHPSGNYAAYGAGGSLILWSWTVDRKKTFGGHEGSVCSITFTPDGVYALTGTRAPHGMITIWDIAASKAVYKAEATHRLAERATVSQLAVSLDCRLLAAAETQQDGMAHVFVWEWARGFTYVVLCQG